MSAGTSNPAVLVIGHNAALRQAAVDRGLAPLTCAIGDVWDAHGLEALEGEQILRFKDIGAIEEILGAIYRSGRRADLVATVTNGEPFVVLTAAVARSLGLRGVSIDAAVISRNKNLSKEAVRAHGIATARTLGIWTAEELIAVDSEDWWAGSSGWVVKPVDGAGTESTSVVHDQASLEAYVSGVIERGSRSPIVVEERITDFEELHIDGAMVAGRPALISVSRFIHSCLESVNGAPLISVMLDPDRQAAEYHDAADVCERSLAALGIEVGAFHMEVYRRRATGEILFGECAVRAGGLEIVRAVERKYGTDIRAVGLEGVLGNDWPRTNGHGLTRPISAGVGWANLPALPSVVVSRPSLDELLERRGVVAGTVTADVGLMLPDMRNSTSDFSGTVVVEDVDEVAVEARLHEAVRWFCQRTVVRTTSGVEMSLWDLGSDLGMPFAAI